MTVHKFKKRSMSLHDNINFCRSPTYNFFFWSYCNDILTFLILFSLSLDVYKISQLLICQAVNSK
jgi:hypothetical protein